VLPLGDASRRSARLPIVTILIIALNFVMFSFELAGGDDFIVHWSLVSANIAAGRDWITILTSMFMHEGWEHILGNMVFLWAFGPEIEDVMGPGRYLVFYLLGGLAATVAQVVVDPSSTVSTLGASGAIAAVMGAFLVTYPRDQIRTVVLLGWFVRVTFVPAIFLVGLWIVTQLFSEVGSLMQPGTGGGVAYMAHIGGFAFGAVAARLFEDPDRMAERSGRAL
jgi:membrane associated rhomboid family serine protease